VSSKEDHDGKKVDSVLIPVFSHGNAGSIIKIFEKWR
jgi:hypothetical protein